MLIRCTERQMAATSTGSARRPAMQIDSVGDINRIERGVNIRRHPSGAIAGMVMLAGPA
jgi:hypothetical protein